MVPGKDSENDREEIVLPKGVWKKRCPIIDTPSKMNNPREQSVPQELSTCDLDHRLHVVRSAVAVIGKWAGAGQAMPIMKPKANCVCVCQLAYSVPGSVLLRQAKA